MRRTTCYLMLCLLYTILPLASLTAATPKADAEKASLRKRVSLFDYLASVSPRLNFYYTVEVSESLTGSNAFFGLDVADNQKITTTRELAADLNKELPDMVVFQDRYNPNVIHFVTVLLKNDPGYPLNRVANMAYRGKLTQLPDELGKQLHTELYTQRVFATPFVSFDYRTRIDFTAKDEQVRSILSNHVPLVGYDRFMWLAETYVTGGKTVTTVDYKGIVKKK